MARKQKGIDAARWFALASIEGAFCGRREAKPASEPAPAATPQVQHAETYDQTRRCWMYWDARRDAYVTRAELLAPYRRPAPVVPIREMATTWVSDVPCAGSDDSMRATITASICSMEVRKCS